MDFSTASGKIQNYMVDYIILATYLKLIKQNVLFIKYYYFIYILSEVEVNAFGDRIIK